MKHESPRMLLPDRHQQVLEAACLDSQLDPEHRARQVWAFVAALDVGVLEARIKSRPGGPGAPAIAPRLLLGLWLYACLDGVGSARELARRCEEHIAYRWMAGRVGVNYHSLSDFRSQAGEFLDKLLSDMIAVMVKAGVVDGTTIHQDGTKVLASAGRDSFRRESTLNKLRDEAAAHVASLKAQAEDQALGARVRAARQRAAEQRQARVDAALEAIKQIEQERENANKSNRPRSEPRASTTDPDARVMKTAADGKRPAYNVQFGTDAKSRAIIGVKVLQKGSDNGQSEAMRPEVERRTGVTVKTHVTDAGYLQKETIEREAAAGVERVMPLPIKNGQPCTAHQPKDGPGVRDWRERMQTEEAKALVRQRSGIAETPNAELKTLRALDRLMVRGLSTVTNVVLLGVFVYNFTHFASVFVGQPLAPR